jgi:hypothetical protein
MTSAFQLMGFEGQRKFHRRELGSPGPEASETDAEVVRQVAQADQSYPPTRSSALAGAGIGFIRVR